MENKAASGWAFQLTYKSQLVSDETRNKNHAKRFVDRFLKILDDARDTAADSLTLTSA